MSLPLCLVALAAGCAPSPADPGPPALTPRVEAPAAGQARELGRFLERPCDLLSPTQMAALGLVRAQNVPRAAPAPADGRGPTVCYAERPVPGSTSRDLTDDLSIQPATGVDVLAEAEKGVSPPDTAMPQQLDGLPALLVAQPDLYVRCVLEVRTRSGQGFEVFVGRANDGVGDTCDVARAVGEAVVATLPRS